MDTSLCAPITTPLSFSCVYTCFLGHHYIENKVCFYLSTQESQNMRHMALLLQMQYLQPLDIFSSQLSGRPRRLPNICSCKQSLAIHAVSTILFLTINSTEIWNWGFWRWCKGPMDVRKQYTDLSVTTGPGAVCWHLCYHSKVAPMLLIAQVCLPLWSTCSESNSAWSFSLCLWKILVPHQELGTVAPSVFSNGSSDPKISYKFIGNRLCDNLKHVPWALLKITWSSGFVFRSSWYVFTLFSESWVILLNASQPHMRPYSWLDCPLVFKLCAGIHR